VLKIQKYCVKNIKNIVSKIQTYCVKHFSVKNTKKYRVRQFENIVLKKFSVKKV